MTRRRHVAFTLLEVIVALAVILILAAVSLPSLAGYLDQQRVDETANQLAKVRDALYNPATTTTAFSQALGGTNAGRLSELDSVIISGNASYATGTDNSCGGTFTGGERNKWISNGPFMTYNSDRTAGMMTPIGRAEDSLTRIPNSASPGVLRLNFLNNVNLDDATRLDALVDGGDGYNAGTVQWTPQTGINGIVTMYYFVPINGTC